MGEVQRYLRRKFTINIFSVDKETMHICIEKKGEVTIHMEMEDQWYTYFSINKNSIPYPMEIKFRDKTVTVWAEDGTKKVFPV